MERENQQFIEKGTPRPDLVKGQGKVWQVNWYRDS